MTVETEPHQFNEVRMPEIARRASDLLSAVEAANPQSPVSLDILVPSGDLIGTLHEWLHRTDAFYDRHAELFSTDGSSVKNAFDRDFAGVLDLSRRIIHEIKVQQQVTRSATLGLAVLQFAEAGARLALDPTLIHIEGQNIIKEIGEKSGGLAVDVFYTSIADRIRGNLFEVPNPRVGYLGHLVDAHYSFWTNGVWNHPIENKMIPPEIDAARQKLIPQFPAKVRQFDVHSWLGRPSPEQAREEYVRGIERFKETLRSGESAGMDTTTSTKEITPFVFDALDAAICRGYSPEACLRLAVQHSVQIGRVTERTTAGLPISNTNMIRYEGEGDDMRLVMDFSRPSYEGYDPEIARKLQRRDEKGGVCSARYPVLLQAGGETHQKLTILSDATEARIGVHPPFLQQVGSNLYVDPAALTVNYVLFVIANNF